MKQSKLDAICHYREFLTNLGVNFIEYNKCQFNIYDTRGKYWGTLYATTAKLIVKPGESDPITYVGSARVDSALKDFKNVCWGSGSNE